MPYPILLMLLMLVRLEKIVTVMNFFLHAPTKQGITGSYIYIGPLPQLLKFSSPFQNFFKTNDTSIESTNKKLLDS